MLGKRKGSKGRKNRDMGCTIRRSPNPTREGEQFEEERCGGVRRGRSCGLDFLMRVERGEIRVRGKGGMRGRGRGYEAEGIGGWLL